jgi:sarcosine oxidase, subunit gamma
MSEAAIRRGAFDGLAPILIRNRLAIEPTGPAARVSLRGPESVALALGQAFGLALPTAMNAAASNPERAAFRLGPDEWLLAAPGADPAALMAALGAATTEPHSLVDVSHRNCGLTIAGTAAIDVLATGVMLDLDVGAFPVGMATRTLFAKAEIVLWRTGPDSFHVELWRSFAPYFHGLMAEAAREYERS